MKEGWTYKKFKDICHSISDGDWIEKKDQSSSGIRLIQTGNIGVGRFIPKDDSHKYISEETFKRLRCSEIFEGDVLISRLPNPLGRSCLLPKLNTRCITAVDCSIIKIKKETILPQFFIFYTQSQGYFSKIDSESSGTTRARITRKKLEETEMPVPPLSEQQRIVARLDAAFAHIDKLKANAEKQLSEARTLFQKALTKAMEPKEGWEEKTFGDVCYYNKEQGVFKDMRYLGMEHMESSTGRILGSMNSNNVRSTSFKFNKGDVLYGRLRPYLQKVYVAEFDGCCSTEVFPIRSEIIVPGFIKYWLLSDDTTNKINATSAGCRMPRGNMNEVKNFPFYYPKKKEERQRIVARLDSLSENVRKYEEIQKKVIAECDALKQALLRKVFE